MKIRYASDRKRRTSRKKSRSKKRHQKKRRSRRSRNFGQVQNSPSPKFENSQIILQKHQIDATYRLVTQNDLHGLLLWWGMGLGKTLGGLEFILNFPSRKVNIICPRELKFVWENELKKIPEIYNQIEYHVYEEPISFLSKLSFHDELIIFDEAQHLVPVIKNSISIKRTMDLFNTSYKTVLLTGTPMYNEMSDLAFIINLAAGKTILPYNVSEFDLKYYKINKKRSLVMGHITSSLMYLNNLKNNLLNIVQPIMAVVLTVKIGQFLGNLNGMPMLEVQDKDNKDKRREIQSQQVQHVKNAVKEVFPGIITDTQLNYFMVFAKIVTIMSVVAIFLQIIKQIFNYKFEDYKYLNTKRLAQIISPYTSYVKLNPSTAVDFPTTVQKNMIVPYDMYQLGLWLELSQGFLSIQTLRDLNITKLEDVEFYTKKINYEDYVDKGVIIGNLKNPNGGFSPKFKKILDVAMGKRAVFYSSFTTSGINIFKEFLNLSKIQYIYLDAGLTKEAKNEVLQKFKDTTTFLLLHPSYTEGITIFGAQQMHILEPIPILSKKEQVIARVARYKSHEHLPESERHVDIYQWACEMNTSIAKFDKMVVSVKKWFKITPEIAYVEHYSKFGQDMTPDAIVLKKERIELVNNTKISKILVQTNKKEKIRCCIQVPSMSQDKECMLIHKKHCS